MNKILIVVIFLFPIDSFGQKLKEGSGILFENRNLNDMSIIFKNSPNQFMLLLQEDFGLPKIKDNQMLKQELHWDNIKIDNLDNIVIKIGIAKIKGEAHLFIVCLSPEGNDLLVPKSDSQKVLKNYFKAKLKEL